MFVLWLAGCAEAVCQDAPASEHGACIDLACAAETGNARDVCLARQIPPFDDPADVRRTALRITDAVLRDSAVLSWVQAHAVAIAGPSGDALCGLLVENWSQDRCRRLRSTAHLQPR